jgi:hypothetical protein
MMKEQLHWALDKIIGPLIIFAIALAMVIGCLVGIVKLLSLGLSVLFNASGVGDIAQGMLWIVLAGLLSFVILGIMAVAKEIL